jgi:hypothetical protein
MSWSLFYDQAITLSGSKATGDNSLIIQGLIGSQLLIEASNSTAFATWHLGCRLLFIHSLPDFPSGAVAAASYGGKVLLNKRFIVDAPLVIESPYSIELLIPWWHRQLKIKIWQRQQVWN